MKSQQFYTSKNYQCPINLMIQYNIHFLFIDKIAQMKA